MKLRLHETHVRLRLGPRDVAALLAAGEVVAELTSGFRYGLRLGEAWAIEATGGLLVTAPAGDWCRDDALTLAGRDGAVTVSLEKDLPCRDGRDAADPNVYHGLDKPG